MFRGVTVRGEFCGREFFGCDEFVVVLAGDGDLVVGFVEGVTVVNGQSVTVSGGCPCLVVKPLGVGFLGFRVGSGVVGRGFGF